MNHREHRDTEERAVREVYDSNRIAIYLVANDDPGCVQEECDQIHW
jgi:hypothetical protein